MSSDAVRDEVPLTNLGQPLFDGADATWSQAWLMVPSGGRGAFWS